MYRAKRRGRNCWSFSAQDEDAGFDDYLVLHGALAHAVRTGEGLSVHYQPKISLADGRVVGMEALARWTHPELGPVGPARFIPIVESSGLIVPLGAKILTEACREARAWDALGLTISVNTSAIQFRRVDDLIASVTEALETSGLPPERLEIELTESTMMDNLAQSEDALRRLKQRGLRVAIDDFGIGYSSLAYLRWLDIDVLKIDQSFVRDLETSPDAAAIACAVIQLARALNMETVAEGIETAGQLAFLKTEGCDIGQGLRFRAPMPPEEVPRFLEEWQRAGVDGPPAPTRPTALPISRRRNRTFPPFDVRGRYEERPITLALIGPTRERKGAGDPDSRSGRKDRDRCASCVGTSYSALRSGERRASFVSPTYEWRSVTSFFNAATFTLPIALRGRASTTTTSFGIL
jgi:EAL domain-containing protein (putative c-di-GMP-specific phosphodiesterase class I)